MAGPESFGKVNIWASLGQMIKYDIAFFVLNGTPVNGTSGSFAGKAGIGSILIDRASGSVYSNKGTKASPTWTATSTTVVSDPAGLGDTGVAKVTYDFSVDGGAIGTILPANSPLLPANAIVLAGIIDVITPLTSGGAASVSVGTNLGSGPASLKAAALFSTYVGLVGTLPVKLSAAGRPTLTVASAALTGGKFSMNLIYVIG